VKDPRDDERLLETLLVLRAQVGDGSAYARLHERFHTRLAYFIRRLLVHREESEDVLQEVWLSVVRKLPALEDPAAFRAWIYRIARHRALSRLRRARIELELEGPDAPPELLALEPEDSRAYDDVDPASLREGLERLSPAHREALTLRFLDDLSYEEIASVIECSVGTVRSRIHYARKALRAELERARAPASRPSRQGDTP
jgi:RNA polymerase sigma-70 factor (ECF subfamily)